MVRIAVVDDQMLARQGIVGLLSLSEEIKVTGEGGDGEEALALVAEGDLDVLLLDRGCPDGTGSPFSRSSGSVISVSPSS